jgi:hypothetical protein
VLDRVLALENILTALGVVAMAQVFVPEIFGRWAPGPFYSFSLGAALILAGSFLRNRAKRE